MSCTRELTFYVIGEKRVNTVVLGRVHPEKIGGLWKEALVKERFAKNDSYQGSLNRLRKKSSRNRVC
jgi:hypothetical protein